MRTESDIKMLCKWKVVGLFRIVSIEEKTQWSKMAMISAVNATRVFWRTSSRRLMRWWKMSFLKDDLAEVAWNSSCDLAAGGFDFMFYYDHGLNKSEEVD